MKKISADMFFGKKLFPAMWFGFLAFFFVAILATTERPQDLTFVIGPLAALLAMGTFGFLLMRKLVWNLVDEVLDEGDALLVRNRGQEERVPFSEIMNVSASLMMNPPRITLRLAHPCRFGSEIAFSPKRPFTLNPFARNPLEDELILRVDKARSSRAS